jgi:hypothetical protein
VELSTALEIIITALLAIIYLPFAEGFVLTFTALLKHIIPERIIRPQTISVALQVLVWVVFVIARQLLGVDGIAFESYLQLITTVGNALLMIVTGGAVAHVAYQRLNQAKIPFWGSPQPMRLRKAVA